MPFDVNVLINLDDSEEIDQLILNHGDDDEDEVDEDDTRQQIALTGLCFQYFID